MYSQHNKVLFLIVLLLLISIVATGCTRRKELHIKTLHFIDLVSLMR